MTLTRRAALGGLLLIASLAAAPATPAISGRSGVPHRASTLPDRVSDEEFWRLSTMMSEPGGTFHSDNFVSNEEGFQLVMPDLAARVRPGGLYLGVGPEQNFTYIAAVKPKMAFILDIRRGNLREHLLYKALFEMSPERADFVGHLFSRAVPAGLSGGSTIDAIFDAYGRVAPTERQYETNLRAVVAWLTERHAFPLDGDDIAGIDYIYRTAFFRDGPDLGYRLSGQSFTTGSHPTYADLMSTNDGRGQQWSYLASESNYAFVRELQARNLVIPVVGDFGGPHALGAIARYAHEEQATVSAFYVSNVEQYLRQDGKTEAFCRNLASLPLDSSSTVIRSFRGRQRAFGSGMFTSALGQLLPETRACAA